IVKQLTTSLNGLRAADKNASKPAAASPRATAGAAHEPAHLTMMMRKPQQIAPHFATPIGSSQMPPIANKAPIASMSAYATDTTAIWLLLTAVVPASAFERKKPNPSKHPVH